MSDPMPQRTWIPEETTLSSQAYRELAEMLAEGWMITHVYGTAESPRFVLHQLKQETSPRKMDPSSSVPSVVISPGSLEDLARTMTGHTIEEVARVRDEFIGLWREMPPRRSKERKTAYVRMRGSIPSSEAALDEVLNQHADWDVLSLTPIRLISDSLSEPSAYVIIFERDRVWPDGHSPSDRYLDKIIADRGLESKKVPSENEGCVRYEIAPESIEGLVRLLYSNDEQRFRDNKALPWTANIDSVLIAIGSVKLRQGDHIEFGPDGSIAAYSAHKIIGEGKTHYLLKVWP